MPSIEELFANATPLPEEPAPLEPSNPDQPDTVKGTGEITDGSGSPADLRQYDSETAFVARAGLIAEDEEPPVPFMFPVHVTQSGGVAGSATTQCTFTYIVYDLNDAVLDNTLTTPTALEHPRPRLGVMVAPGTLAPGVAYRDLDEVLHLWDVGEVPAVDACP